MKNDATINQMVALLKPDKASAGIWVPVIMATASPVRATEPVGNGCRISATIVPTKMPSMCIPCGSTPAGVGRK